MTQAQEDLSLGGKIVGVTVIGTDHHWDLMAYRGQIDQLEKLGAGEISLWGKPMTFRSPVDAVRSGMAMIPEDRRAHGVAIGLSVGANISLASLDQMSSTGFVNRRAEARKTDGLIGELEIQTQGRHTLVKNLSGGNQQKVVVAKWLPCNSQAYLLDEPTVAVDVGPKVEIYNLMNRLAAEGKALVFMSSDFEETTEMCDRILVIYRGGLIGEYRRGEIDADRLLAATSGSGMVHERKSS